MTIQPLKIHADASDPKRHMTVMARHYAQRIEKAAGDSLNAEDYLDYTNSDRTWVNCGYAECLEPAYESARHEIATITTEPALSISGLVQACEYLFQGSGGNKIDWLDLFETISIECVGRDDHYTVADDMLHDEFGDNLMFPELEG